MALVELTPEEHETFKLFTLHKRIFEKLLDKEVFTVKRGRVILHFDSYGNIQTIEIIRVYS